ncbi:Carcinoembryonic antigen-related cell adhesion molecule 20 [Apodemus speciosus]|uniref:Carcinoembryonic antigen-related cell adhesion molecule 20 n=1 Tax=Apodemus speciosus TaxID=105296 RepID=A0ABQ0EXQ1_APOSI
METAPRAKPTLRVSQSLVTEQRDKVVFYCDTGADNDDVAVHWMYNNSSLAVNERMLLSADNKTLTILVVQREDLGSYLCDSEGQRSDTASLTVNYGPDPVSIKLDSGVVTGDVVKVMEGHAVNFRVETQSRPPPNYTWYVPSDSAQSSTTEEFSIPAVSREHEGLYRCLVSNTVTNLSRLGVVEVQVLGNGVSLVGSSWSLDGGALSPQGSVWLAVSGAPKQGGCLRCNPGTDRTDPRVSWWHHGSAQRLPATLGVEFWRTRACFLTSTSGGLQSSSMSPGAIAGIVIGILVAIALAIGLGFLLYSTKDRWIRRRSASDKTSSNTTPPTSVKQSPPESRHNKPKTVHDSTPKPQREAGGRKVGIEPSLHARLALLLSHRPSPHWGILGRGSTIEPHPSLYDFFPTHFPPRYRHRYCVSPEQFYEKKPPQQLLRTPGSHCLKSRSSHLSPLGAGRNEELNYEKKLSAAPEDPRKPLPQIPKQPLVPPEPGRNEELNYEETSPQQLLRTPGSHCLKLQPLSPEPGRNEELNYEEETSSAAPEDPRKPLPQIPKQPLVSLGAGRNEELNYEKKLSPSAPEDPRKPLPQIRKQPLVPPEPGRNEELNYRHSDAAYSDKKPPSAALEDPRKPLPQIPKQPLVPLGAGGRNEELNYEKKPPSAAPEDPRKPLPQIPKQPLVPPEPGRNEELNYEKTTGSRPGRLSQKQNRVTTMTPKQNKTLEVDSS